MLLIDSDLPSLLLSLYCKLATDMLRRPDAAFCTGRRVVSNQRKIIQSFLLLLVIRTVVGFWEAGCTRTGIEDVIVADFGVR